MENRIHAIKIIFINWTMVTNRYVKIFWILRLRNASRFRYISWFWISICNKYYDRNKNTCKSRRFLPHSNQSDRVLSASLFSTSVNDIIYCWKNVSQDGKKSPSNALLTPQAFVSSGRVIWTLKIVKIIFIFIKLR